MSSGAIRSMLILTALSIIAIFAVGNLVSWWWVLAIWGGGPVIFICIVVYGVLKMFREDDDYYLPDVGDIAPENNEDAR